MNVKFVYRKNTYGGGFMQTIPRVGDLIKINREIYRVEYVIFDIVSANSTIIIIYLADIMDETKNKLKYF